jgi:N-acetylmuramic acid 6-phosphate etherase
MTNMKASNEKLQDRAVRILIDEAGLDESSAAKLMDDAGGDLRVALVMSRAETDRKSAEHSLREVNDVVEKAVEKAKLKQ